MAADPTDAQLATLLEDSTTKGGEVVMLNLLKFRAEAGDGLGGTGEDAYNRYGAVAIGKVAEYGGSIVWMGRPDSVVVGDDDANDWDVVVLVRYPSRVAFLAMAADPDYAAAHVHRHGGIEDMALVAMTPAEGFGA